MSYFYECSPQHGYQQMVVKSVALYWDLTRNEYALAWLQRLAPYFPMVMHRSGLMTDAEQPHLKHHIYQPVNPATPGMLACILGDGENRWVAEVATKVRADNVLERMPSFLDNNPHWYNYHHATYAAALLRLLEHCALPQAVAPSSRRIMRDASYRGVRSHWDEFTASVGTRQMNDSLAGAYIADPAEPMLPLDSALDGIYFEVLQGNRGPEVEAGARARAQFRCVEWSPTIHQTNTEGFSAVSCMSRLCSPYWGDMTWIPGERWRLNEVAAWSTVQHWAVWRDHLVGLASLNCGADGGDPNTQDVAQVRWRLSPVGRKLEAPAPAEGGRTCAISYGRLRLRVALLSERGGFGFGVAEEQPKPYCQWSPVLRRAAPWSAGDYVQVAMDAHPDDSDGTVHFKPLNEAAAALLVDPGGKRGFLWIASLVRHWRQHLLALPEGVTARLIKGDVELTPVPADNVAVASLSGGESAVWVLETAGTLEPEQLLASLTSGQGRGEARPARN